MNDASTQPSKQLSGEEYVRRLKSDFYFFIRECWKEIGRHEVVPLGDPDDPEQWVDPEIAQWAQNGPRLRGVLAWRQFGKALDLDTPIPTADGWTTMRDIRVGDTVFDECGKPCRVKYVSDVFTNRPCFRVTFSDGSSLNTDKEHDWIMYDGRSNKNVKITTGEMVGNLKYPPASKEHRYSLPQLSSIQCQAKDLPIDPYVLGLWLGDGHSANAYITHHANETEEHKSRIVAAGFGFREKKSGASVNGRTSLIRGLHVLLRLCNLINNKHIPSIYLRASYDQRMELLRGLMDTDGTISKKGFCSFSTTRPQLRDGFTELLYSLGYKPSVKTYRSKIYGQDCGEAYEIHFCATAATPVFKLSRKCARLKKSSAAYKRKVVSVEPIKSLPVRCIEVDSASHLYLAGKSFIPTHNTTIISVYYSLWLLFCNREHKICVISKSSEMAMKFLFEARQTINLVWFLRSLAPRDRTTRDNAKAFDVHGCKKSKDPSFVAKGIDGQITGSRAHTIIADDIEDKENCQTIVQRQKLEEKTNEFNAIIYNEPAHPGPKHIPSQILIVGTFHHEDSVYKQLAKKNIEFRTWCIVYPHPGEEYINLSPTITKRLELGLNAPGDVVAPYRVNRNEVNRQMAVGDRYFRLQYKLQANVRETNRYPLKLSDLIVFDSGPITGPLEIVWGKGNGDGPNSNFIRDIEIHGSNSDRLYGPVKFSDPKDWIKYNLTACAVDPGGSGESRTAWTCGSSLNGAIFIHALHSNTGGAANIPDIASTCFRHRCRQCYVEGNLAGAYDVESNPFAASLQVALNRLNRQQGDPECPDGWNCLVSVIHSVGQKELRIVGALESPFAQHQLIVSRQVASNKRLQYQITNLTSQRGCLEYYDEIDSLTILVKAMAATFMQDSAKDQKSKLDRYIEAEMANRSNGNRGKWHSVMGGR